MDDISQSILDYNSERIVNILKGFSSVEDIDIIKSQIIEFKASIGIVIKGNSILLGKVTSDDERDGKWCFPGGGIENGEDSLQAAIREVYEESGIITTPLEVLKFQHPAKPYVTFCLLRAESDEITFNEEYVDMSWFDINDIPDDILPLNLEILNTICK